MNAVLLEQRKATVAECESTLGENRRTLQRDLKLLVDKGFARVAYYDRLRRGTACCAPTDAGTAIGRTGDPGKYRRRSIRLQEYDYSTAGAYFVTVCVKDRQCLFGNIVDGEMGLNVYGREVDTCWDSITGHFAYVRLDAFVVMPNHVHGIIVITGNNDDVGARHAVPLQNIRRFGKPASGSLSTIIRSFKSAVTKRINEVRNTNGATLWQRNYYEHVVRDEDELDRIRQYVSDNQLKWERDRENPNSRPQPLAEPWEV